MKDTVAYTLKKGRPLLATIPATAGNVAYALTPGSGYIIEVYYGVVTLVCNGTAGNRLFRLDITNAAGTVIYPLGYSATAITAGLTATLNLRPTGWTIASTDWVFDGDSCVEFPKTIYDTDVFKISIINGLAGDSFSGYIKYLLVKR